ncbi:MAG: hypothetical protein WC998_06225, partial [Candidatus Paceibacterota bacterium]
DKWEDVSEWLLNKEFEDIQIIKNNFDGHKEMLTFEYWKNKIQLGELIPENTYRAKHVLTPNLDVEN